MRPRHNATVALGGVGTTTSDRLCSLCSTCETGFATVACTATTNTNCVKHLTLTTGDVGAIVLGCAILVAAAVVGVWYGRRQLSWGKRTRNELEMTEMLLSDVTEKHERLQEAWVIPEQDVVLEALLASGAFGTVWKGRWGMMHT